MAIDELDVDDCLDLPDGDGPVEQIELRFCDSSASSRVTAVLDLDDAQRREPEAELVDQLRTACVEAEEPRPDQGVDVLLTGDAGNWAASAWCVLTPP